MKLMWFHLMPYTELPDDFREKNPSVWVDIHSSLFDPKRAHLMYNDFMDELEYAAECGFDAVCVNEHHSNGYGLMPSPNLIASSLARRTTDTAICVMGNSLALYNPPTRVAEEFAMIDCISGGRLIAGFPVGTPMDTCYAYGQNPVDAARALSGGARPGRCARGPRSDTFAFNGRFNQQRYVNIWPRPMQQPHPPIWVPGGGSVETWQWCAEMDYVYCYLSLLRLQGRPGDDGRFLGRDGAAGQGPQSVPRRLPAIRRRRREPRARLRSVCASRRIFLRPLPACRSALGRRRPATPAKAASAPASRARCRKPRMPACAASPPANVSPRVAREMDAIVDKGYVIIGSPDEVAEQLREVATNLNVGHLMLLLQFGNMSKDLTRYNTKLFAEKVMPKLKGLFADWEDRWWPQPMDAAQRAEVPAFHAEARRRINRSTP